MFKTAAPLQVKIVSELSTTNRRIRRRKRQQSQLQLTFYLHVSGIETDAHPRIDRSLWTVNAAVDIVLLFHPFLSLSLLSLSLSLSLTLSVFLSLLLC